MADLRDTPALKSLVFRGRSPKPMRVSVQLRFSPDDTRWMSSVYLDGEEREVVIPVEKMVPAGGGARQMPPATSARSILFVVDLVNARPGETGAFTLSGLRGILPGRRRDLLQRRDKVAGEQPVAEAFAKHPLRDPPGGHAPAGSSVPSGGGDEGAEHPA